MSLQAGITVLCLDDPEIQQMAQGRVHWMRQPLGSMEFPYLNLRRVSEVVSYHLEGEAALVRHRIQADAWAESYVSADALAKAVKKRLSGFRGDVAGRMVDNFSEWFEAPLRQVARFQGVFHEGSRDLDGTRPGSITLFGISQDFIVVEQVLQQ